MSKHKRLALLTREPATHRHRPEPSRPQSAPTVHVSQGPTVMQASRMLDDQYSLAERRSLVRQVGAVLGNRELQSVLQGQQSTAKRIAQRGGDVSAMALRPTHNAVQLGGRRRSRAKARTVFRLRNKRYSIRAKSLAGAIAAMTKKYGAEEWGSCKWYPRPRIAFDKETDTLIGIVLNVKIVITMPRWSGVSRQSKAVQTEWKAFSKALLEHEKGHEKLVRTHLGKLVQSLLGKNKEDARSAYESALKALKTASEAYDKRTKHGRTQGAVIDSTIK